MNATYHKLVLWLHRIFTLILKSCRSKNFAIEDKQDKLIPKTSKVIINQQPLLKLAFDVSTALSTGIL